MTGIALATILLAAAPVAAVEKNDTPQQEAMRKLDFLAGKWQGPATYQTGKGKSQPLQQVEEVQFKLKGTVLLVEGTGRRASDEAAPGGDEIVFNALGVISYDLGTRQYRVKAYTLDGRSIETELKLLDKGIVWGFPLPKNAGEVRHTMKLTDKGDWHEISEFSRDGKTWFKSVEMTLTRVKE
jgi:hypothetical protein